MRIVLLSIAPLFIVGLLLLFMMKSHSRVKVVNGEIFLIIGALLTVLGVVAEITSIIVVGVLYVLYGIGKFYKGKHE